MTTETPHNQAVQLLQDAGYETGWALADGVLVLWEHDAEPPAPLTRPEASDETPSPSEPSRRHTYRVFRSYPCKL